MDLSTERWVRFPGQPAMKAAPSAQSDPEHGPASLRACNALGWQQITTNWRASRYRTAGSPADSIVRGGASVCGAVHGTSTLDQDRRWVVAAVRTRLLALALRSDLQETSDAGRMRSILEGLSRRDPAQVVIRREHPVVAGSVRAERGPGVALQISERTCRYRIDRRGDIGATRKRSL